MPLNLKLVSWFQGPALRLSSRRGRRSRKPVEPAVSPLEARTLLSVASATGKLNRHLADQPAAIQAVAVPAKATGLLKSAQAVDSTTIRLKFKAPISPRLASGLRFDVPGLEVENVQRARNGRSAVLTTSPQQDVAYTALVSTVKGTGGATRVVKQATAPFAGKSTGEVLGIGPVGGTAGATSIPGDFFAIGFDDDTTSQESNRAFRIAGFQDNFGLPIVTTTGSAYAADGQWAGFRVAVGRSYLLDSNFIYFANDDDVAPNDPAARSAYRNVVIYEEGSTERTRVDFATASIQPYNASQDLGGTAVVSNHGTTLELTGNTWKRIPLPYSITPGTILEFDFVTPTAATPVEFVGLPYVVGAISTSNTSVVVSFSEAMADTALNPAAYVIVQVNQNPEAGTVYVTNAQFASYPGGGTDRSRVLLTTTSQNELTYNVTAVGVTDLAGNHMPARQNGNGGFVEPTAATFPGTPPRAGDTLVDTDGDGLSDNNELRGYEVAVTQVDGTVTRRGITSDPTLADTDGDGLSDYQEFNLRFDPRTADTDDDQLGDFAEFNELFSNGLAQDTDADGLDDFVEWAFFRTSPLFADSDGDQISDGDEINGNRNALVSDLPRPEIEVGGIDLRLDVRFSESNARETRELENREVTSSLKQSESRSLSRQYTANLEAKIGTEAGFGDGSDTGGSFVKFTAEATAGFTFQQTEESSSETERNYETSLSTEQEVTAGFTVERQVVGAVMQATVNLRNVSNLAYRVKNLQVTAFIQDPQDRTRLTPVATLLPDAEPEEGYTLGPFVTNRGPIIFSNTTIVPNLVESLMANSAGLIFRISNYDIINEDGRNFAFVSQDVVERTAQLVVDFGGARSLRARVSDEPIDENLPGDETEIHRVSTSQGRPIADTDTDGDVDSDDRRATFDGAGKEVGITLFDALAAIGLTRFESRINPDTGRYADYEPGTDTLVDTSTATEEDRILNSYSTYIDDSDPDRPREKIFRIRGISNDFTIKKVWEILTPLGIDRQTKLDELILKTDAPVSLNFVQDLDGDLLPADVEYLLRTSDTPNDDLTYDANGQRVPGSDGVADGRDTDGDGLDDRFEALIGWTVNTPLKTYTVFSSPNRRDSNFDTPKPEIDSDLDLVEDRLEYDGSDGVVAPAGWDDKNFNGLRDRFEAFQVDADDLVLDPVRRDTDEDGIRDATELVGFRITRIENGVSQLIPRTKPLTPFSDSDTFTDGFERLVGLDPNDGRDTDEDGDGLPDVVEGAPGWAVGKQALTAELQKVRIDFRNIDPLRTFTLQYGGGASNAANTTVILSTASTAAEVQAALNDLTIVRQIGGRVSVTKDAFGGGSGPVLSLTVIFNVTFEGSFLGSDQPQLIASAGVGVSTERNGGAPSGAFVVEGVSLRPYEQGPQATRRGISRTDSVDTDEDGLTDYEEFFLRTDPASKDTDGDGLEDRVEHLGYDLGHKIGTLEGGIIKTDPLDADSDNDLRSDGDEAELVDVELKRYVVRTTGAVKSGELASSSAYRVFSHPTLADADFDGLVDGQEFSYGTDPNNANTDGDKRNDGVEFVTGTNPLVDDFLITVFFTALYIGGDGDWDPGDENGDIAFDFGVRKPGAGSAGLDPKFTSAVRDTILLTDPFRYQLALTDQQVEPFLPNPGGQNPARSQGSLQNNQFSRGIAFEGDGGGSTLRFAQYLPAAKRSITFGMTADQAFSVEGIVAELDLKGGRPHNSPSAADYDVFYDYLGGVDGLQANAKGKEEKVRPVFRGTELQTSESAFLDYEIGFAREDQLGGNNGDSIFGRLFFTIFIG